MNVNLTAIKQRFGIIGFDPALDRALNIAVQVASTDLSVLITGESGVGKESFPKIIHEYSSNKHGEYIAVNCGAIPDGTIDSELFGHEKGAFTGATESRKGYFEVANGGTIFLDEVADLPLPTQVRLLRVLENGEFIKVGSSKVQKTKVRIIAATNVNIIDKIAKGKFREDLYYRLNTVPIFVPPLRERKDDIVLIFTKFASDFAEKYRIPQIELTEEAMRALKNYSWPGNIRQLKNITEQISLIEKSRLIDQELISKYLTTPIVSSLPMLIPSESEKNEHFERELVFKFLADMKREVSELRTLVKNMMNGERCPAPIPDYELGKSTIEYHPHNEPIKLSYPPDSEHESFQEPIIIDEDHYSIEEVEKELIKKALEKNHHKRKNAADELGISERTLYRKIKEYGL